MKCAGILVSGYWKGSPCGATPMAVTKDGKAWCWHHLPAHTDKRGRRVSKPFRHTEPEERKG